MKMFPVVLVIMLAGCSGSDSPNTPSGDAAGTATSEATGSGSNLADDGTGTTAAQNPNLPVVRETFDSLMASNANVTQILETCRSTYTDFNNAFLSQDSNAVQVATELVVDENGVSVDAVQVQWLFINQPVVTTQNTAIEANSGGGIFLMRDGECGVDVFQGFGFNQDQSNTLQQFKNPSDVVTACLDQTPVNSATIRKYPLYDIAGTSYGQYRHDYVETTETEQITYQQVYQVQFSGANYFVACPAAVEVSREATQPISTRVDFEITVPVFVSDALQVRLVWGDKDLTGAWVEGESWSISDDFPANTENLLTVTFNDNNGDITLGSFEQSFTTGTSASQTFQVAASQFDTGRWDSDGDGISNINELIAGSNPLEVAPTFTMVKDEVLNRRCGGCHSRFARDRAYDSLVNVSSSRLDDAVFVIPFDPDNSYLIQKLEGAEGIRGGRMPNSAGLPEGQTQLVRDWIAAGALDN